MAIEIIGNVDPNRLYCAGSFSKLLTTFVSLSLLSEHHNLSEIIDDENFLDQISNNDQAHEFLSLFQKTIGSKFTLHDICTFYAGLPYTFDVSEDEIEHVDTGYPYKHHSIPDESAFLYRCKNKITQVYSNRSRFLYSELSILFLGYLIEKIYKTSFEKLYAAYVIEKFKLHNSCFSRKNRPNAYIQDLSDAYDLASIAIRDNGYFCYSNGFYTTLTDTKILLEGLIADPVFCIMADEKNARAASNRLMNGLTVELRRYQDDLIIGYDGLSYSGCNLWAYSTKHKKGYLTFNDNGDLADKIIFDKLGYPEFDKVPEFTQRFYIEFLKNYDFSIQVKKDIPLEFQGDYHRVKINDFILNKIYKITHNTVELRNSDDVKYDVITVNNIYRIKNKDNTHGEKIGLYTAKSGNKYLSFGGFLLKKI